MDLKNLSWRGLYEEEYNYLSKKNKPFYLVLDIVFFVLIISFISSIIITIVRFNLAKDTTAIIMFTFLIIGTFFLRKQIRNLGMADINNKTLLGVEASFGKGEDITNVYKGRTYYESSAIIRVNDITLNIKCSKSDIDSLEEGDRVLVVRPSNSYDVKIMSIIPIKELEREE